MVRTKSPVRLEWMDPAICSPDYRLKLIDRLPFFKHLSADAISKIDALFRDHDISAGERVYFEGDEADYLYLVAMRPVLPVHTSFVLDPVSPFSLNLTVWTLRRRADNVVDRWDGQTYRRVLVINDKPF